MQALETTGPDHRSVIVLEDEAGISNALSLTLRMAGIATFELSGASGLETALLDEPFAVILDVSLAKSDAVEVLRILSNADYAGVVQLISGSSLTLLEEIRQIGLRHGLTMLPVIRKPFRMQHVKDAILNQNRIKACDAERPAIEAVRPSQTLVKLADALAQDWMELWYQPKFDLRDETVTSAECLARIRHPEFGVLLPGAFLPGAGQEALDDLTSFVIRRACRDWTTFRNLGVALRLAINVSAHQLLNMPLAQMVRDHAPSHRDWKGLTFELTEEDALQDVEAAREAATQLSIYNVTLSIDDFGLGYSSLSRLRDIPFREVKLDRTLVHECAIDKTKGALCRAVIELSHTLKAKVVAEGVERAEDLAYLKTLDCDFAQGFLLARPTPADQLVPLIRRVTMPSTHMEAPLAPVDAGAPRTTFGLRKLPAPAAETTIKQTGIQIDVSI